MKIRRIKIDHWRNLEGVVISPPELTGIVCLVGANGTGKSNVLELIAACAHQFGVSRGVEIPRGNVFAEPHSFEITLEIPTGIVTTLDKPFPVSGQPQEKISNYDEWDRTLTLLSSNTAGQKILAGGISEAAWAARFAQEVQNQLRTAASVHYLSLDADRSYPKLNLGVHQIAEAFERDPEAIDLLRDRAFRPSRTLYDDWIKDFFARENRAGTRLMQQIRQARDSKSPEPTFVDHFDGFKKAVLEVLPHLAFSGVEQQKRTISFDSSGTEISFDQLSGGEREIAFLIGQIERFQLRNGLLLVDEPELHLNADLLRTWISYLKRTVLKGQIWLSTHSLEVVEIAGQSATFVLERDESSRKVRSGDSIVERPLLSVLSRVWTHSLTQ